MKVVKLVVALCLFATTVFGQDVMEGEKQMKDGVHNAYTVEIVGSDMKSIQKSWVSFIKKYKGKTKKNKKTGEYFTDNATIKMMSENTVDIYSTFTDNNGSTVLTVWFDLGGVYLSSVSHPEKTIKGKAILLEFASLYETKVDMAVVRSEEDKLKDLQNQKKKLEKDFASHNIEIEKAKQRIIELEAKKVENLKQREAKTQAIKEQQVNVQVAKDKLSDNQ